MLFGQRSENYSIKIYSPQPTKRIFGNIERSHPKLIDQSGPFDKKNTSHRHGPLATQIIIRVCIWKK